MGVELVTWVMSVGEVGKEEGRGVCEGLLRLGVLRKVGSVEEGELFSSGARYTWTGEVPRLDTQPFPPALVSVSVCIQHSGAFKHKTGERKCWGVEARLAQSSSPLLHLWCIL